MIILISCYYYYYSYYSLSSSLAMERKQRKQTLLDRILCETNKNHSLNLNDSHAGPPKDALCEGSASSVANALTNTSNHVERQY